MAPTNTKSYREVKVDSKNVEYDPAKRRMRMHTEVGYNIIFEVEPHVSINWSDPWQNGIPEFQTNIMLKPLTIEKDKNPFNKEQIKELLDKRSVIPDDLNYENFTVGFVYATPQNPQNHKWMFEFRRRKQIFWAQHFLGINLKRVPITTTSWFEGVYHGRFLVQKPDVATVVEDSAGYVTIIGQDLKKVNNVSDFSKIIPPDYDKLRLRYNIREDYWYGDILKKDQVISDLKPLKIRQIAAENLDFKGVADFSFQKPKVYYLCDVDKLADVKMMAETLFLSGKGDEKTGEKIIPEPEPEVENEKT